MASVNCEVTDLACHAGEVIGGVANSAIESFVRSLAEGVVNVLEFLTTFWINVPSPDLASPAITTVVSGLSWYTFAFAVIGLLFAIGKMMVTLRAQEGLVAVKMLVNLIVVTGAYTAAAAALISAGDAFTPWIIDKATGGDLDLSGLLTVEAIGTVGVGPGLLLAILGFLGSLANVIFMLIRVTMISLIFAFLPTIAAASATESGMQAFKKAQGYLIAFLLFKPIAGIIYALGFLMVTHPPEITGLDDAGRALFNATIGVMTLALGALCLPALIKFIVPVAANGLSSAFSGAAAGQPLLPVARPS